MNIIRKQRLGIYLCLIICLCLLLNAFIPIAAKGLKSNQSNRPVPLLKNLGNYHHKITTNSPKAQQYFDQGLISVFGFNHAEGLRLFQQATKLDPNCAMCYWGIALSLGPHVNAPMGQDSMPVAYEAIQKARQLSNQVSPLEQAYIKALSPRYSAQPVDDRTSLDFAYAQAMEELSNQYPEDLDAATLSAESLMDLMPWNYWTEGGKPRPETKKVLNTLESVLAKNPQHPGATHYYIHAVEASDHPEKAEIAADNLRNLIPGSGHLVHMPSHIYRRVGRYHDAAEVNQKAIAADETYLARSQEKGLYSALYYPHNIHFFWSVASIEGRSEDAIAAARKLVSKVSAAQVEQFPVAEMFLPTPYFSLVQFQQWDEMLTEPKPLAQFPYTLAMWHYGRGMAWAAKENLAQTIQEKQQLEAFLGQDNLPTLENASIPAYALIEIADELLAAKIASLQGKQTQAIAYYQAATNHQYQLPYMEPPHWYYPIRQSLGASLIQQGKAKEAEAVYREDLQQHPQNGWSLFGLAESLKAQGKPEQATQIQAEFEKSWSHADIKLTVANLS
ncbi:MAG: tetratricopeptide repeat protein [Cyanobacteria bacterium P01_G01_bin.49]